MAAVHPRAHLHSRLRSSSDPFVDPALVPHRMPPQRDISDAVRDTVTVRRNTESSPRSAPINNPSPRPPGRRSQSQDSAAVSADKPKSSAKGRPKKGSQHADVIDRLDFTGVGPMFHHDGPFDACAPSRNRQPNKAPMFAWSSRPEEVPAARYNDSAYPSADAYKAFSNDYVDPPKKKVDAIAEAWGIHEPEPYEEFFAGGGSGRQDTPASSIYNGKDSHNSHSTSRSGTGVRRTKDGREVRDIYREYLEEGQQNTSNPSRARAPAKRSGVPPPQPIFVPDPSEILDPPSHSPSIGIPGVAPNRSKSLMNRIRKMRDAPNVPVSADHDDLPSSPSSPSDIHHPNTQGNSTRPTHRSQNSFLGRFGGTRANQVSPSSEKPEPYVFIDPQHNNKALPPTPHRSHSNPTPGEVPSVGYFDGVPSGGVANSPGLGRKTSIMKKVGRVVRGTK